MPKLAVIIQPADYPPEALAANIEGVVPISLSITPEGALRCTVIENGAPRILQRPSCQIVASRWPFGPNVDAQGVAKPTTVAMDVHWRHPSSAAKAAAPPNDYGGATPVSPGAWISDYDYPLSALSSDNSGSVRIAFDVKTNGTIENCVVVEAAESRSITAAACPAITKRAMLLPAIGPDGAPRATKAQVTVRFAIPK